VNPFRYTARESDTETGLYYYRARYYDQNVGRFISEDPIEFDGGKNFCSYVENPLVLLTHAAWILTVAGPRFSNSFPSKGRAKVGSSNHIGWTLGGMSSPAW
jgi:RHS repeat-associated protein